MLYNYRAVYDETCARHSDGYLGKDCDNMRLLKTVNTSQIAH